MMKTRTAKVTIAAAEVNSAKTCRRNADFAKEDQCEKDRDRECRLI